MAKLLVNISGGKLMPCDIPENFHNSMSKEYIGYTFFNHPSFTQHHLQIVKDMLKNPDLNIISMETTSNQLALSQPRMIKILQECAEINKLLIGPMVCLQITTCI